MPIGLGLAGLWIGSYVIPYATLYKAIIYIALIAISYACTNSSEDSMRDLLDQAGTDSGRGVRANTRSTQEPLPVLWGTCKIGGNDVFISTAGASNNELWIVQTLSEGPVDSIAQVDSVDQVFLDDKLYTSYSNLVDYYFHTGTYTQTADADLAGAFPEWADAMRGVSYIIWKMQYDQDYFNNIPKRLITLKGRTIYDPRTETTAYSTNPALILRDYMLNETYGMSLPSTVIDTTSWNSAANYCDTKSFTMNYLLADRMQATKVLDTAIVLFRGCLIWYDGKFYLKYADLNYESSCLTLTDSHIVQDQSGKALISMREPGTGDRPDALRVKFNDPDKDYLLDDVLVGESTGIVKELRLDGCADRNMAINLANYNLERIQLDRTIVGTFQDVALQLEPNDVVTFTSTALGVSDQLMRVNDAVIGEDGLINLTLAYESADLYDDNLDSDIENVYTCSLPDPYDRPPSVSSVTETEEVYYYRLRSFTRLKIDFEVPTTYPWFDHVEVWVSTDNVNYKHQFNATSDFMLDPVDEGITYYVMLVAVNTWGAKQNFADGYKITRKIVGKTAAPSSLDSLAIIANDNAINLYADEISDADVEGYEFRFGTSWSGGVFLAYTLKPNLSLKGVKPGSHTFYCNTKGNNQVYGGTPRFATASVPIAHGWSSSDTSTADYSAGTHSNTESATYNEEPVLKCSHTGGVLSGTWLSEEFDLGSALTGSLAWIDADIVVSGEGTAWEDQFLSGTTWTQGGAGTRSWAEIFELAEGPQVSMKLCGGPTTGNYDKKFEKAEILSGIIDGRYFKVEIGITDPNINVNALVGAITVNYYA